MFFFWDLTEGRVFGLGALMYNHNVYTDRFAEEKRADILQKYVRICDQCLL